jgi:hypothetical protein
MHTTTGRINAMSNNDAMHSAPIGVFARILTWSTRFSEFVIGFQGIGVGLWLLLPFDTFASNPAYGRMASFLPEWAWGGALFIVGISQVLATALPDARSLSIRRVTNWLMMVIFLSMAFTFGMYNIFSTGVPSYGIVGLAELFIFIRLQFKANAAD